MKTVVELVYVISLEFCEHSTQCNMQVIPTFSNEFSPWYIKSMTAGTFTKISETAQFKTIVEKGQESVPVRISDKEYKLLEISPKQCNLMKS